MARTRVESYRATPVRIRQRHIGAAPSYYYSSSGFDSVSAVDGEIDAPTRRRPGDDSRARMLDVSNRHERMLRSNLVPASRVSTRLPVRPVCGAQTVIVERGQIAPHQYEVQVSNSSLGSFGTGRSGLKFAIR